MRTWCWLGMMAAVVGCDGGGGADERVDAILALTGDPVAGEVAWQAECADCHNSAAQFAVVPEDAQVRVILDGTSGMPAQDDLPDQDIADIVAYVVSL
jgi:mono/diheme cytochrome c family protein